MKKFLLASLFLANIYSLNASESGQVIRQIAASQALLNIYNKMYGFKNPCTIRTQSQQANQKLPKAKL